MDHHKKKIRIYILCHDDESFHQAHRNFKHFPWAVLHRIESTVFLESHFYAHVIPTLSLEGLDYVGTLAYKASDKINLQRLHKYLTYDIYNENTDPDIVSFYHQSTTRPMSFSQQAERSHPGILRILTLVIQAMDEEPSLIFSKQIKAFYGNYWMARPSWVNEYSIWLRNAMHHMVHHSQIKSLVNQNSGYMWKNKNHRIWTVFQRTYIPFHPFVAERLPCYFFFSRGVNHYQLGYNAPEKENNVVDNFFPLNR